VNGGGGGAGHTNTGKGEDGAWGNATARGAAELERSTPVATACIRTWRARQAREQSGVSVISDLNPGNSSDIIGP